MVFFVYYGENEYATEQAVVELHKEVGSGDLAATNSHRFYGGEVKFVELQAACWSLPFLAEKRFVHVSGLLSEFERDRSERRRRKEWPPANMVKEWSGLGEMARAMPDTTILVLTDGEIRRDGGNWLLAQVRSYAALKENKYLGKEELMRWMKTQAGELGASITPGALTLLAQWVGRDQRILCSELAKLSVYAAGRLIDESSVRALVPQVREGNMYAAVDALIEGRLGVGVQMAQRLQAEGMKFSELTSRLAEQLRRVLLAQEVLDEGGDAVAVRERLNISHSFVLEKIVQEARGVPRKRLEFLMQSLLEADLAIKRGQLDEDIALHLMLSRFFTPAPVRRHR
jgi:DNA polymerase-3 subunit delta